MQEVILNRVWSTEKYTFGILIYNGNPICLTLELPWNDNQEDISCIPAGEYDVSFYRDKYHLANVPNRKYIEMHIGNTVKDTHGCILFGDSIGIVKNRFAVLNSAKAMTKFIETVGKKFKLIIV